MQSQEHDGAPRGGSTTRVWGAAPRILEAPTGRWVLQYLNVVIGKADGLTSERHELLQGDLCVTLFRVDKLYWDHVHGLKQLQGVPVGEMLGPNYLVLNAEPSVCTNPRPHLRNLVMAAVHKVPNSMNLLSLFAELRQRFC
jgi:hypothetical protein